MILSVNPLLINFYFIKINNIITQFSKLTPYIQM